MSNKLIILSFILTLGGAEVLAATFQAKTSGASVMVVKKSPFIPSQLTFPESKEEEIIKNLKMSSSQRRPANNLQVTQGQIKELTTLVNELHSLKTSEEIEAYLQKLDANYDQYPNNVKFYIASIIPMTAFRGMFYRLRPMFESNSSFLHSEILTFAKSMASRMNVYLPFQHVDAVYEYVSSPYFVGQKEVASFSQESDVQIWQVQELLPRILKSIKRLEALNLVDPVIWDQRIAFGPKSFQDDLGRFKQIAEFEKNIAVASLYQSVAAICIARAYSVDNAIKLAKDTGKLYGFDGFGFSSVEGVSAQKMTKVMKMGAFKNTAVLMPDGQQWMKVAYEATKKSIGRIKRAWNYSASLRNDEKTYVFNVGFLNINREEIEQNLELMERVVMSQGIESMRSAVTGEIVQVNFRNIFINPPKDLKAFLPSRFEIGATKVRSVKMADGTSKKLTYRNYEEGRAIGWNTGAFTPYFPSVNADADIERTLRVLSHAGGNWLGVN